MGTETQRSVAQFVPKNEEVFLTPIVCCSVLQCVAVCCGALYCVAVCCNVLQKKEEVFLSPNVCCSVLQRVAVCSGALHCVAVYCSVLQQKAEGFLVRCSVLQCIHVYISCVAVCYSVLRYAVVHCSVLQYFPEERGVHSLPAPGLRQLCDTQQAFVQKTCCNDAQHMLHNILVICPYLAL